MNGRSAERVKRVLFDKHCRCKRSQCFRMFKEDQILKFLKLFWSFRKPVQDHYATSLVSENDFT